MATASRTPFATALRCAMLLCAGWWCVAAGQVTGGLRLSVATSPPSLPFFIAEELGFFTAEGIAVTLGSCDRGATCLADVTDGRADIAAVPNLPLVIKRFERQDYALIASVVTTLDSVRVVANRRAGIATAAQLAGKRVGIVVGSASNYYLDLMLAQAGLDATVVMAVPLLPEQMADALADGRVDAVSIWEPFALRSVKALAGRGVVLPDAGTYIDASNLVAAQRLVGVRDAALVAVLRALDRAEEFIRTDPKTAQAILRRRLQIEQAFVDRAWPLLRFRLSLDQAQLATFEAEARWARREGHVGGELKPNFLSMIHAAPLHSVKPGAVGMGL